ncbi:MAG: PHP domain-containing protein [Clostridia bacterium]
MKLAVDLHIHSCLSPCGDAEMTPNNIVNMAYIKGLDVIAVSDHNSARNLPAISSVADGCGILLLPALEVETREEVHVLCYLPNVDTALALGEEVYKSLPDMPNMPDFYGEQQVMDEDDAPLDTEPRLLVQSTMLSLDEVTALCRAHGGVPVPAHINRTSNSLISSLGFIPPQPVFTTLEVYSKLPPPKDDLSHYHVLYSSDAHYLENMLERESFISVKERSVAAILDYLNSAK